MATTDFSSSGGQIIVTVGSNDPINYSPSGSSYGFLPNYPNRLQVIFISANIPVSYIVELADLRVSGSGSAPADEAAALTALDAVWADAAGGGGSGWTPLTTRTITSAQTLTLTDGLILCNASNNNIVDIQLPDPQDWYGVNGVTPLTIMRIDDQSATWSVNFDSQANGATIPNLISQYSFFSFESDGSLWKIVGNMQGGEFVSTLDNPQGAISNPSFQQAVYSLHGNIVNATICGSVDVDFSGFNSGTIDFSVPMPAMGNVIFGTVSFNVPKLCNAIIVSNSTISFKSNDTSLVQTEVKFVATMQYKIS